MSSSSFEEKPLKGLKHDFDFEDEGSTSYDCFSAQALGIAIPNCSQSILQVILRPPSAERRRPLGDCVGLVTSRCTRSLKSSQPVKSLTQWRLLCTAEHSSKDIYDHMYLHTATTTVSHSWNDSRHVRVLSSPARGRPMIGPVASLSHKFLCGPAQMYPTHEVCGGATPV